MKPEDQKSKPKLLWIVGKRLLLLVILGGMVGAIGWYEIVRPRGKQRDRPTSEQLRQAIAMQNIEAIRRILTNKPQLVQVSGSLSPLLLAVRFSEDTQVVEAVLKFEPEIEAKDDDGNTALHIAAEQRKLAILELLLKHGANPHAVNDRGQTVLHAAASPYHGAADVCLELESRGCDLVAKDDYGWLPGQYQTTLHSAEGSRPHVGFPVAMYYVWSRRLERLYAENREDEIQTLLKNAPTPVRSWINLDAILRSHHSGDFSGFLICAFKEGANPNESNRLVTVVRRNHEKYARIFLEAGADPDQLDQEGNAAMHWAASNCSGLIIESLLEAGGTIDIKSRSGRTPLDWAVSRFPDAKCTATIELLIEAGHPPTASLAALKGDIGLLEEFHQANPDALHKNRDLIQAAIRSNQLEVIDLLLEYQTDLEMGSFPNTALIYALSEGKSEIAIRLIEAGVDVTEQEVTSGNTALHIATQNEHPPEVIQSLLENGANPNATDREGRRPVHFLMQGPKHSLQTKLLGVAPPLEIIQIRSNQRPTAFFFGGEVILDVTMRGITVRGKKRKTDLTSYRYGYEYNLPRAGKAARIPLINGIYEVSKVFYDDQFSDSRVDARLVKDLPKDWQPSRESYLFPLNTDSVRFCDYGMKATVLGDSCRFELIHLPVNNDKRRPKVFILKKGDWLCLGDVEYQLINLVPDDPQKQMQGWVELHYQPRNLSRGD